MTDRELLEMAALAAGIEGAWQDGGFPGIVGTNIGGADVPWNPLHNDGQALRLAVKLKLLVDVDGDFGSAVTDGKKDNKQRESHNGDPYAATRRAIVRAAAEIGKYTAQGDVT